ncbi:MAG: HesA/MoeB/ThiF family protein, partial [Acutalibacteraceae bacterium]
IILAVDNSEARAVVNGFCQKNRIPVIDGGIDGFYGKMYFSVPGKTPCLFCAGMISHSGKTVSVSSTAGLIGSLEATAAIRYLSSGDESMSGKIYVYDSDRFDVLCVKASVDCAFCK